MQPHKFLEEFNNKLANYYSSNTYKVNPYRASSAGECARKLAFLKLFPEQGAELPEVTANTRMQLGNILHDTERALYKQLGYKVHSEEMLVELPMLMDDLTYLNIRGKIDGFINVDGEDILFDIKTANEGNYKKVASMGLPYSYKAQASMYMNALKLDKMWFMYYDKNRSNRMVLEYEYDPNMYNSVVKRFSSVYNTTCEEDAPAREFLPYRRKEKGRITNTVVLDAHCASCPFHEKCYPQFSIDDNGTHYTTTTTEYAGPYSK